MSVGHESIKQSDMFYGSLETEFSAKLFLA